VSTAEVGRGIVMRRFHARGRGRSAMVEKWFSHLKIVVEEREAAEKPSRDARPGFGKKAGKPVAETNAGEAA
ncbi:MAG: 50S ribosomal protein L22, partial [Rhodospirillales bacterium]|nr:50S ribosomal protein L22 [Rhodospirillales bacterium]